MDDLSGFIPKIPSVGVPAPTLSNPDAPSTTPAGMSTSGNSSPLSGGSSPAGAVAGAIANSMFPGAGLLGLAGFSTQRLVLIILGLLLIAAGIFAFRPVRETVIETAKTGAKAAAVAA